MTGDDEHLILFLRDSGLLSRAQIHTLLGEAQNAGETFYRTLLGSGILPEDDVRRAVSKALTIPFVNLVESDIHHEALVVLPEAFCRTHAVAAYKKANNELLVAVLDLSAVAAVESLRLPYKVVPILTDRQSIKRALLKYQQHLKASHGAVVAELTKHMVPVEAQTDEALARSAEHPHTQQLVDALLVQAISQRAQAIHFEPKGQGLMVRYRVANQLYDAQLLPLSVAQSIASRIKILSNMLPSSTEPQEGRFTVALNGDSGPDRILFRVATIPLAYSPLEKIVLRLARESEGKSGFMLESLGLHGAGLESVHRFLAAQSGLVVVCGEERSGATTLLYTLLDHRVDPAQSVVTVETRVEVHLPGVVQTQTNPEKGESISSRIPAALRMDPDVLMVSDCNTQETTRGVVSAANHGRFVITKVHASGVSGALAALLEDAPGTTLGATLLGVVATKLVRRLCKVHEMRKFTREELEVLQAHGADLGKILDALQIEGAVAAHTQWKDVLFGQAVVCAECGDGYDGMVGLQEVVPMTLGIKDLLARRASREELEVHVRTESNLSLLEDAIFKAAQGRTSVEEVFSASL